MNGIRELVRKLDRLKNRIAIFVENRRLKKAEIILGFLGWQQAEYFSPELKALVEQIMHVEKAQAELANQSAELADKIADVKKEREKQRQSLAERLAENEAEAKPLFSEKEALEQKIDERRHAAANFKKASSELDSEDKECSALLKALADSGSDTFVTRNEILRLRDRRIALEDEKLDVEHGLSRSLEEAKEAETNLAGVEEQLSKMRAKADGRREEFNDKDRGLRSQIDALDREKLKLEKEMEKLDSQKTDPYLLIGQVLANCGIAPLNQPDALERVVQHRTRIAEFGLRLAASAAESAQAAPKNSRATYFFLFGLLALVGGDPLF